MNKEFSNYDFLFVDHTTPIDILEPEEQPENDYRDAARKYVRTMSICLNYIQTSKDKEIALLGVIYALGLYNLVEGKSQRETARDIGLGHSTISNHVQAIQKLLQLEWAD